MRPLLNAVVASLVLALGSGAHAATMHAGPFVANFSANEVVVCQATNLSRRPGAVTIEFLHSTGQVLERHSLDPVAELETKSRVKANATMCRFEVSGSKRNWRVSAIVTVAGGEVRAHVAGH